MTETCSARKLLTPIFPPPLQLSAFHLPHPGEISGPFEAGKIHLHLSCHHDDYFTHTHTHTQNFIIREHAGRKIENKKLKLAFSRGE